jgi:predicted HAD superfamily Cof-like phosphohydrolase
MNSTSNMFDDVGRFHEEVLGLEPPELPTLVNQDWILERQRFMLEELNEFCTAAMTGDMVKAADGLVDVVYVALGTAWQMGLPWDPIWRAVQKANMAKRRGITSRGNAVDAVKPPGWQAPEQEIAQAILARINASTGE